MKKPRLPTDAPAEGLTHNPFAALRGDAPPPAKVRPAAPVPEPAAPAERSSKVVVRREKKGRGGKTVTRVSGLGMSAAELDVLARELKRALGCGASLEAQDVLLQGALTERAAEWLRARLGTPVSIGN